MAEIIGNLDTLLTRVQHTARSDADGIQEHAAREADQIREEAERRASESRERILADARQQATRINRHHGARELQREKQRYLETREKLFNEVFRRAEEALRELRDDPERYAEALSRLAVMSVSILGPGTWVVASDERGHELLSDERLRRWAEPGVSFVRADRPAPEAVALAASGSRGERPGGERSVPGGLVVSDEEGRRTVNASFRARLALAREELREEILGRLLSDE